MKATEAKFIEFLKKSPQFVIPIYQRTYSWTQDECRQLWDDILRTGSDPAIAAHFVGSIVYIKQRLYQITTQPELLVIDDQQRLTPFNSESAAAGQNRKSPPNLATTYNLPAQPNRYTVGGWARTAGKYSGGHERSGDAWGSPKNHSEDIPKRVLEEIA